MSHISPVQARESISRSTETDSNKLAMYELATCRAENYLLKQRMTECEGTIQSLKQMVATIAEKQVEVLDEVLELRKYVLMPPKKIADMSTSTAQDGISEPDTYMPDSDNEEWTSSQAAQVFSPYISPQASSDSGSETDVVVAAQPMEQYDLATNTMPAWSILYSIKEEIEPEDSQEDCVIDYQVEPDLGQDEDEAEEDSQNWAVGGDN